VPPPDETTTTFIRRLLLGTRSGKVKWKTESEAGWFCVDTPAGTASVRTEDNEGDHPYVFEIVDPRGITIARVETVRGDIYADWEQEIRDLYVAARNDALGIQQTIEDIADQLDLPPLPPQDDDIPF
jgi:hypothetical protein